MTSYNLRVLHDSSAVLHQLVLQGHLQVADEHVPGICGTVYRPRNPATLDILSHFTLRVHGELVHANLYALPPEEYSGMLLASPQFAQFALSHLLPALNSDLTPEDKNQWVDDVLTALQAGPRVDPVPRLLEHPVHPARWRPEATRFSRSKSGWFLTFDFEDPQVDVIQGLERAAVGIDVGLRSLAVACFASGLVHRASGVPDIQIEDRTLPDGLLPRELERHLTLLQHSAARNHFQSLIRLLVSAASVVYIEDLRYPNMSEQFKSRSRVLGLRDFMMSWLPQRLMASGIEYERVSPDLTSQMCSVMHLRGTRDRQTFTGPDGRVMDADLNAARNLLHVGFAERLSRLKR